MNVTPNLWLSSPQVLPFAKWLFVFSLRWTSIFINCANICESGFGFHSGGFFLDRSVIDWAIARRALWDGSHTHSVSVLRALDNSRDSTFGCHFTTRLRLRLPYPLRSEKCRHVGASQQAIARAKAMFLRRGRRSR